MVQGQLEVLRGRGQHLMMVSWWRCRMSRWWQWGWSAAGCIIVALNVVRGMTATQAGPWFVKPAN
jgi:hypothetical protein